jgi:hypothetical protein
MTVRLTGQDLFHPVGDVDDLSVRYAQDFMTRPPWAMA